MSTTVYGLKNCDTCKKATKWLDRFGVPYTFVDYRDNKPSPETLLEWAAQLGGQERVERLRHAEEHRVDVDQVGTE